MQLSHASPIPSPSLSFWSGLNVKGQLSIKNGILSLSESEYGLEVRYGKTFTAPMIVEFIFASSVEPSQLYEKSRIAESDALLYNMFTVLDRLLYCPDIYDCLSINTPTLLWTILSFSRSTSELLSKTPCEKFCIIQFCIIVFV